MKRVCLAAAFVAWPCLAVAVVAFTLTQGLAADTRDPGGNEGVHIVPLRSGDYKSPEGHELRPGQFPRGTKFQEEPKGWVDGDPCWKYTDQDNRKTWAFACD
jgi:hypothetical protein